MTKNTKAAQFANDSSCIRGDNRPTTPQTLGELSHWLDAELANLEAKWADYVTANSLKREFRRGRASKTRSI